MLQRHSKGIDCNFKLYRQMTKCFSDALRVAKKSQHLLAKTKLSVTLLDTWPETTTCAIRVCGFKKGTSEDTVAMFFESTKRSGGDHTEDVFFDEINGFAVITYKCQSGKLFLLKIVLR